MVDYRCIVFHLIITLGCLTYSETFTGRVVDSGRPARPIANAAVSVQPSSFRVYTDSLGCFSLSFTAAETPAVTPEIYRPIRFINGKVLFSCNNPQRVRLELFTLAGKKAVTLINRSFKAGIHELSLPALIPGSVVTGMYIATAEMESGRRTVTPVVIFSSQNLYYAGNGRTVSGQRPCGKAATAWAGYQVVVSRMGYETVTLPLSSLTVDFGDIVLSRTPREAQIDRKVDSILALMTIEEKAGQMVQTQINFTNNFPGRLKDEQIASMGIGSVFNGGSDASAEGQGNTPDAWAKAIDRIQKAVLTSSRLKIPIIYGQDCVHGVAEISGCTVFPHNIGLGCTGDTILSEKIGRIIAAECAGIGIRLNFWPCIASVRNERWGRTYEGFGETPEINTLMGTACIRGLHGNGDMGKVGAVAACAKHFLGDGGTDDGVNNGETSLSDATMRAVHLPPYAAAARELVATVMPSYHTWVHHGGRWKQTLDHYTLTTILKTELGFDGFCISDWDAIPRACDSYRVDCVARAVNAGLDMAMIIGEWNCGEFINSIKRGVSEGIIPISRIDDAVRRILRIKFRFGLFDHPYSDAALRSRIYSPESRAVARECVRKSLVLLKNESQALPLRKTERIAVAGAWANSMGAQCGGWTISWQGSVDHTGIAGQTILQGMREKGGDNVFFSENGDNVANADKIVVVAGESPYAEEYGDRGVPDFSDCPHASLVEKCFISGKPVILVMVTGRPMIIDTEKDMCKAIVAAWLPGSEGGGVADVLYGEYNFTGKLTHTWPASAGQIPINAGPEYADEQKGCGGAPLFPYGYGLSY